MCVLACMVNGQALQGRLLSYTSRAPQQQEAQDARASQLSIGGAHLLLHVGSLPGRLCQPPVLLCSCLRQLFQLRGCCCQFPSGFLQLPLPRLQLLKQPPDIVRRPHVRVVRVVLVGHREAGGAAAFRPLLLEHLRTMHNMFSTNHPRQFLANVRSAGSAACCTRQTPGRHACYLVGRRLQGELHVVG
jgi:hypothetical protein